MDNQSNNDKRTKSDPGEIIPEESPYLRSVAISGGHSSIPLPRPLAFHEPAPVKASSTPTQRTVSTHPRSWMLQRPLAPMPFYYHLDRTHVYIADISADQVAENIADCLRRNSIACTLHPSENKVDADTLEHVKFAIRLWSDKEQVVVEVQRKCGCCYLFNESARLVLLAARGSCSPSNSRPASPRSLPVPLVFPGETEKAREEILTEGLEIAESLLKKERLDAQLLAMESLIQLSKAPYSRSFAAQYIFKNESILTTLLSLIESYRMSKFNDDEDLNDLEQDHLSVMRRHALTILGNCLAALEEDCDMQSAVSEQFASKHLLGALVGQVFEAQSQPHDACQAARCLGSLIRNSEAAREVARQLNAPKAIALAHSMGVSSHQELQVATSALMPEL